MEFVRGSTLLVTLMGACVCAALIFGLTLLSAGTHRTAAASPAEVQASITAPKPPKASIGQVAAFTLPARPLFHETRRPYESEGDPVVDFAPEPTNSAHLQLRGVIKRGGTARAYVELIGGGEPVWLNQGDTLAGWTLKQVTSDGVVLAKGTRDINLKLYPQYDP
ncbi:hypothetical protein [Henriciella sp.]|mgnify:CR=1 FL=1|uniref:hypothetical protein n=1 Tax=Henriciella sp. TaxID=1968823 RepID=UPI00262A6C96|nr:hypothetical protein [Henriciella sp.]